MQLSLRAVLDAVGGTPSAQTAAHTLSGVVDGVSTDSRTVRPGQLFVPLVAARDGHDFIADARRNGAPAHLAQRGREQGGPGEIVVADTAQALEAIGALARRLLPDRVIAITGSSGKTTTKDLTAAILARRGPVIAPERSFNNELGVPLTLANGAGDAWATVLEMGARAGDHIARLCRVGRPTVSVITNIGWAHLGEFGSREEIALAKREIFEALPPGAPAIVWASTEFRDRLEEVAPGPVVRFDDRPGPGVDYQAADVVMDADLRPQFRLVTPVGEATVRVALHGAHQVLNALAAAAAAMCVGATLDEVVAGLEGAHGSPWRMEMHRLPSGARLINDAYNANPASVRAALDALAATAGSPLVAVLGPMLELGAAHDELHAELGAYAAARGIELWAVGTGGYGVAPIPAAGIAARLRSLPGTAAVVVKASRAAGLEQLVADALAGTAAPGGAVGGSCGGEAAS